MSATSQDFRFTILDVAGLLPLRIKRRTAGSFYVDCPFCGDTKGRLNISRKNVWRCNRCDASGGMLALYARMYGISNAEAYREICEALGCDHSNGDTATPARRCPESAVLLPPAVPQAAFAAPQTIHQTLTLLLEQLSLSPRHKAHLLSPKRGLTDAQIERFGFKSTPPSFLCRGLAERLLAKGCTLQGVPGFYQGEDGKWTVNFPNRTSGILIPAVGMDGLLCGMQILLDRPLRDKDDPPEKKGAKYIWFSSNDRLMGVTSGSPVHFVGDPFAKTVYVTEGLLKADIAHCLTGRSFVAVAGVSSLANLERQLPVLAHSGTRTIVEAFDMDKQSKPQVSAACEKMEQMVLTNRMQCIHLTWDATYKGIDDWQLALRAAQAQNEPTNQCAA